ncbi:hypothetical protein K474DRAFT_902051 [Panus rudis PR-1116 ss-1]|nr:hypothetical protein K474DRAFT_902051 [Panus rudis PR-1116 ss-1]
MNSARPGDGDLHLPRLIRHITSIQIRNLTPYPVRDTFASALTQPSQQPQFTPLGGFSDDLDVTVGRRRGRRISSASTTSARNAVPDREGSPSEPRRRFNSIGAKPTSPRTTSSLSGLGKPSTSPAQKKAPNVSPPGVGRPALRQRTSSTTSSFAGSSGALPEEASATSMILPNFLRDTSQRGLENILRSRLVETYITLTVLPSETTPPDAETKSSKSLSASSSARALNTFTHRPTASVSSVASGSRFRAHQKTMSISNESATSFKPSANTSHRQDASERGASPKSSTIRKDPETPELLTPDFYSEVHKASTNPSFIIDPQRHLSTAKNLSGSRLRVEVWARSAHGHEHAQSGQNEKGKGRATGIGSFDANGHGWKVLESWDVDLNELIPLPDDFASHPTYLPANTLFITLSPPDKTFYLPQYSLFHVSRSPSPSTGYISDPELDVRRKDSRPSSPVGLNVIDPDQPVKSPDSVSPGSAWTSFKKEAIRRTVGWQDLLKLVTLQKCIQDTKSSLEDVVHDIDHLVTHDTVGILNREVSERRAQVRQLEVEKSIVLDESQNLKARIDMKKEELRLRREALAEARRTLQEGIAEEETRERELLDERTELVALRNRLPVLRSSLISIVSFIYPIELVSPPDLLFSILDVPLPIPVAPTDPAPPLNLTGISEDVVATALGYAAQVVQLLASYLNVHLTYPVTCIGSRSLIKDGISAMVGPRMFPLFSRGVDTYRFEYGVFLLNKDIELLMSERDLRALDMRHTLPNLKNLLLTLTDADAPSQRSRPLPKANSEIDGLRSPIPSSSSLSSEPTVVEEPIEGNLSKAANNAKTSDGMAPVSTQSSTVTRKSRAFLGLPPLSGFLRVRYPSSSSRTEAESESVPVQDQTASSHTSAEVANEAQNGKTSDDESDRRTIRGVAPEQEPAAAEEKDSVSQTQRIPLVSR